MADTAGGPRATVQRQRLSEAPYATWNAFVDLLATAHHDELSPLQRVAFFAFRYDAEVKTGGHVRYFRHHGTEHLSETALSLERLGAPGHRAVLEQAARHWHGGALAQLDGADDDFHALEPDLHVRLEAWLEAHLGEFIVLEG